MEKIATWDRNTVMCELNQGRELANDLKRKLHTATVNSISRTTYCGPLMEKIISSYDNALSLLNCSSMALLGNGEGSDPDSIENSPRSEGSDPVFKDYGPKHNTSISKKRKTLGPRWSEQVRVCTSDGQLEDGYNWRKYGQKDILRANHPRAYYRCTYRPTQGCLATKQVQKTDEDPSVFDVIYRGNHSCIHERLKQNFIIQKKEEKKDSHLISNETFLKVENQELLDDDDDSKEEIIPPFSFPSIESENVEAAQLFFPDLFLSPTTSDLSFLSPSPSQVNGCFGIGHIFENLESDFSEIISNSTSVTDFQFEELDFLIDQVDFESDFIYGADCFPKVSISSVCASSL